MSMASGGCPEDLSGKLASKPWFWGCRSYSCSQLDGETALVRGMGCEEPLHSLLYKSDLEPESDASFLGSILLRGGLPGLSVECKHGGFDVIEASLEWTGPRTSVVRARTRPLGDLSIKVYKRPPPADREWMMLDYLSSISLPIIPRPLCRALLSGSPYLIVTEYVNGVTAATLFIDAAINTLRYGRPIIPSIASSVGRATAILHASMFKCSYDWCKPRRPSHGEISGWVERLKKRSIISASLSKNLAREERKIVNEAAAALKELSELVWPALGEGLLIQTHGDLHLYQIYVTGDGRTVLTDFEGEPSRDPASPMELEHPERDLAAISRSIDYASIIAAQTSSGIDLWEAIDIARERLGGWVEESFKAVLDGYRDAISSSGLEDLEPSQDRVRFWLVERASYELVYELRYRTGYHLIPATALLHMQETLG